MNRQQERDDFAAKIQMDFETSRTVASMDRWGNSALYEAARIIDPAAFAPSRKASCFNVAASDALGKARKILTMLLGEKASA